MREPPRTPEWRNVDRDIFWKEIVPLRKPAVLRGLAADWPAVRAGMTSAVAVREYLGGFDAGKPVPTFFGPSAIKGHFWYRDDMRGLNYQNRMAHLGVLLDGLLELRDAPEPPALYAGAIALSEHLPGFEKLNHTPIPDSNAVARIWIGNAVTVSTHFDLSENIAVAIAGRRRFTLFPPEQVTNLYVGPFDFTFAGPPVSMVDLREPDLTRFPRFAEALESSQVAELQPGDAIYVPYMWWHHVESLDTFNVLVNYWWELVAKPWQGSPFKALMHAIMSVRDLPEREREVWRVWFDHYVFGNGHDAVAHLPPQARSVLGEMTPEVAMAIKQWLMDALRK
jgi:Cupin-like domain